MVAIASGMNYALLYGGSSASSMFATIAGGSGRGVASTDPLTALRLAQKNQAKGIADQAKDPVVARDLAAFRKGVAAAKDAKAALSNPAVLKVLLTSNGLGDQVAFPGLAVKALMSDPSNPKSLANQLSGTKSAWLAAAKTYDFAKNGLSVLKDEKVLDTLANGYAEIKWRQAQDKQTPGLSSALQFQSQASKITDVIQILGDPVNRDVVLTALNIPLQIAYQSLGAQEAAVSRRLDVKRLQDPKYVQALTQRYLLTKAEAAASSADLTSLAAGTGLLA